MSLFTLISQFIANLGLIRASLIILALGSIYLYLLSALDSWRRKVNVPKVGSAWGWNVLSILQNKKAVMDGYQKYPNQFFQTYIFPFGTTVVANGRQLVEEIKNGPNDAFSFDAAGEKSVQAFYTCGIDPNRVHYETPIILHTLTRNLAELFPELMDEMEHAFNEVLDLPSNNEWKAVPLYDTVSKIVQRTSNRIFVGLPLCRNDRYHQIALEFVKYVTLQGLIIGLFPDWMLPIVGPLIATPNRSVNQLLPILKPFIEERRRVMEKDGKAYMEKPNDFLTWLIDSAPPGIEQTLPALTKQVLAINFVGITTTGMNFTHLLFHLAAYPQYTPILEEEARSVIAEHGWSKTATQKMYKADSFLRECMRLNPVGLVLLIRLMLKDWTFSDGTCVKKGNWVAASCYSTHMDEAIYEDAETFKPWRFSDLRDGTDGEVTKHQVVFTSPEFLAFGEGRHACPGRFFASNELKAMLAYVLLHYDVKLAPEANGSKPANTHLGVHILPNRSAKLMFRVKKSN